MSRRRKTERQQEAFREIVELSFQEFGLPTKLQPDMCCMISERKRFRQFQEREEMLRQFRISHPDLNSR
jgi:hypothetical protein